MGQASETRTTPMLAVVLFLCQPSVMIVLGRPSVSDRPETRPSTHVHATLCFLRSLPSASLHPPSAPFTRSACIPCCIHFLLVSPSYSLAAPSSRLRGIVATRPRTRSTPLHHRCSLLLLPSRHRALHAPHCPCDLAPCTPREMRTTVAAPMR